MPQINIHIDKTLKQQFGHICNKLGLNMSEELIKDVNA